MSIQSNVALLAKIKEMIPLESVSRLHINQSIQTTQSSYTQFIESTAQLLSKIYKKARLRGSKLFSESTSVENLSTPIKVLDRHSKTMSAKGIFKLLNIKVSSVYLQRLKKSSENNQKAKYSPYNNPYKSIQDALNANFNDESLKSLRSDMCCLTEKTVRNLGLGSSNSVCSFVTSFTWDSQNPFMSLIDPQIHSPQIPEFLSKQNLFRKSGEHTDAILVVQGREFPVHKTILKSKLEVFEGLLGDKFNEGSQKTIDLSKDYSDLRADIFDHFLEFTYTEYLSFKELSLQEIIDLHACAHYFGSKELENQCISQLKGRLTRATFWDIFDFAFHIKNRSLDKQLKLFMFAHLEWIEGEFKDLSGYSVEELLDCIDKCNYFELTKSIPKLKEEIQKKIDLTSFDTVCQAASKDDDLKKICGEFVQKNQYEFDRSATPDVKSRFVKLMLGITLEVKNERKSD